MAPHPDKAQPIASVRATACITGRPADATGGGRMSGVGWLMAVAASRLNYAVRSTSIIPYGVSLCRKE